MRSAPKSLPFSSTQMKFLAVNIPKPFHIGWIARETLPLKRTWIKISTIQTLFPCWSRLQLELKMQYRCHLPMTVDLLEETGFSSAWIKFWTALIWNSSSSCLALARIIFLLTQPHRLRLVKQNSKTSQSELGHWKGLRMAILGSSRHSFNR